jgi:hypothetical protein
VVPLLSVVCEMSSEFTTAFVYEYPLIFLSSSPSQARSSWSWRASALVGAVEGEQKRLARGNAPLQLADWWRDPGQCSCERLILEQVQAAAARERFAVVRNMDLKASLQA